jgi:hypothetical protein
MLHAGFVVAVLSDLFGIQARSGCFCAGPYVHRAHPIGAEWSARMHACAAGGELGAKLAFTRLSFAYHVSDAELAYVLDAVLLLAEHGWKLLPAYRFDPASGQWEHRARRERPASLEDMLRARPAPLARAPESVLAGQLAAAREILRDAPPPRAGEPAPLSPAFERIRWFPLPGTPA